jgi:LysM repeat protein
MSTDMNISRSSRRCRTALSLATAILLGACAHPPISPDQAESGPATTTVGEPPLLATSGAAQAPVALQPDHPQTYTVVPGDTLWSIAGRFLQNPWQWRQIWRQNPQIRNPNRIYPGDVLRFSYDANGQPQLEVAEREEVPLLKLSPQIRVEELSQPIPPVPRDAIESFLTRALVLSEGEWQGAPYIVADDDNQVIYADRDRVYARGAIFDQPRYQVFRPSEPLIEPGSGRSLGVAGIYMGQASLEKDADPATLVLSEYRRAGPARRSAVSLRGGNRALRLRTASRPTGHRGLHLGQSQSGCDADYPIQQRRHQPGRSRGSGAGPCPGHLQVRS